MKNVLHNLSDGVAHPSSSETLARGDLYCARIAELGEFEAGVAWHLVGGSCADHAYGQKAVGTMLRPAHRLLLHHSLSDQGITG